MDVTKGNEVVEWLNWLNGFDYFYNVGSVATTLTTTLGRILMYPQLSLVGCLIFKCNLIWPIVILTSDIPLHVLDSNYPTRWIPISNSSLILV